MAKKGQDLPPEIYYDYVQSIAKNWTKYSIPISFIDPKTKYRVEGYIYGPKKRNRLKSLKINAYYNFESVYLRQPIEVDCKDILPSRRRITKMEGTEIVDTKIVDYTEDKATPLSFIEVRKVYDAYKGINWTIPELATILNQEESSWDNISKLPFLKKVSTRSCRITNKILDTYCLDTPEPLEVRSNNYSIDILAEEYKDCTRCSLCEPRKAGGYKVTMGRGNKINPKIMLIGEAPGTIERDTGIVFNPEAPAGGDLQKVMKAADIDQDIDCYLTNSVLCWPPPEEGATVKNGKPTDEQMGLCSSRLKTEILLLKPKVIVLLGAYAYKAFFGRFLKGPITGSLGWQKVDSATKVYLAYHPSYITRQLSGTRDAEIKAEIKLQYLNCFKEIKKAADE